MKPSHAVISIALLTFVLIAGCSKSPEEQILPLDEAHHRLKEMVKKDYQLDLHVTPLENTVWVYVPTEHPILQIKASEGGPKPSKDKTKKLTLQFIDGYFSSGVFRLQYDIDMVEGYPKDYGYGMNYSKEYSELQRFVLTAISRVYSEAKLPGNEKDVTVAELAQQLTKLNPEKQKPVNIKKFPLFFVIVIADVKTGVEAKLTVTLHDLFRGMVDHSFHEEYTKRLIAENATGHQQIIDDYTGVHLKTEDMTWPDFLTKQMIHRIKFKYNQSDFPPLTDNEEQIMQLVEETLSGYGFADYSSVELHDMTRDTRYNFRKDQIPSFRTPAGKE